MGGGGEKFIIIGELGGKNHHRGRRGEKVFSIGTGGGKIGAGGVKKSSVSEQ
jgi:hypothetical protein